MILIPPLDHRGLLPPGVHITTLEQIPLAFCINDYRWNLWDSVLTGLNELCNMIYCYPEHRPQLILGGSFFSDKLHPNDIEATLLYPVETPPEICWLISVSHMEKHDALKQKYDLDYYPSLPNVNDFSVFFQYVGTKTAAAKGLYKKDRRGVLEVLSW